MSPLARVGPGVTVPSGFRVLPGANVTTDEEASQPEAGHGRSGDVDRRLDDQVDDLGERVAGGRLRHALPGKFGHRRKPGASPTITGINNGNLAAILGANLQPGPTSASFEPAKTGPRVHDAAQGLGGRAACELPGADHRAGSSSICRPGKLRTVSARANAFRADQGQPITIGSIAKTGRHVTINSPLGGTLDDRQELPHRLERRRSLGRQGECGDRRQRDDQFGCGRRADLDRIRLDRGPAAPTSPIRPSRPTP